jgi:hypothetical protein
MTTGQVGCVRFQVFTAVSMMTTVVWDVAPCSLVEVTSVSEVLAASMAQHPRRQSSSSWQWPSIASMKSTISTSRRAWYWPE